MKYSLHVVSTEKDPIEKIAYVNSLIHPYVDFLHIRKKQWSVSEIEQLIKELVNSNIPRNKMIVNNQPDLAKRFGLGGVHFPELVSFRNYPSMNLLKGSSVHSEEMAIVKEQEGADYLFFGHIYETTSKPGLAPRGLHPLHSVTQTVSIPVIAIGGITPERVHECLEHGASGVAVMSTVYQADDPVAVVKAYRSALLRKEECLHESRYKRDG